MERGGHRIMDDWEATRLGRRRKCRGNHKTTAKMEKRN